MIKTSSTGLALSLGLGCCEQWFKRRLGKLHLEGQRPHALKKNNLKFFVLTFGIKQCTVEYDCFSWLHSEVIEHLAECNNVCWLNSNVSFAALLWKSKTVRSHFLNSSFVNAVAVIAFHLDSFFFFSAHPHGKDDEFNSRAIQLIKGGLYRSWWGKRICEDCKQCSRGWSISYGTFSYRKSNAWSHLWDSILKVPCYANFQIYKNYTSPENSILPP